MSNRQLSNYTMKTLLIQHAPQVFRFLVSGGTATVTHLGTFYVLSSVFGVWYGVATTIGFLLGFGVSFNLQKYWTFQDRQKTGVHKQAGLFFVLQIGNLLANLLAMMLLVEIVRVPEIIAQIIVLGLLAVTTFVLAKFVVFTTTDVSKTEESPK